MNEIQFCIFIVTALGVAFITPPLASNLLVISLATGDPVLSVAAKSVSYLFSILFVVLLIAFFPSMLLWWMS